MYLPTYICNSPFLPGLSPSLFSFLVLKLKGSGVVFTQNQSGIEFLTCLAGQPFKDRRTTRAYQVVDIIFREKYAADVTEDMEVAALVPALGYLGIDADTLLSALGAAVYRIGLLL